MKHPEFYLLENSGCSMFRKKLSAKIAQNTEGG
jgi:hypothetical protein